MWERRQSARSLSLIDCDGETGVSAREPVRHFHVEFVRGSYRMFGSMNESTAVSGSLETLAIRCVLRFGLKNG